MIESSPYIDHSMNSSVVPVTGETGLGVFLDGYYDHITTDADTTIDVFNGQIVFRSRVADIGDIGLGFNATLAEEKLFGYGCMDFKFSMLDDIVSIYPDIGFGTGLGTIAWSFDVRTSMAVKADLLQDIASIYAAPRLIGLVYPYYEETSGGITVSYSYAMMPMYGISAGVALTVPLEDREIDITISPNVTYLRGHEPKADQVDVSVFQAGCIFGITF